MSDQISGIFDVLKSWLNPSALSWSSIEGIIVIVLVVLLIRSFVINPFRVTFRILLLLLAIHIGFVLSFTRLNDVIPLRAIFKYDILASPAQLFAGTPIADGLLWVDSFAQYVGTVMGDALAKLIPGFSNFVASAFPGLPW